MTETRLLDVWLLLQGVFRAHHHDDPLPEFDIVALTPEEVAACVLYLMRRARELSTRFHITGTDHAIQLPSLQTVHRNIVNGDVSAAMWVGFPKMPGVGVYVEHRDRLSIAVDPTLLDAMTVLHLFDLFGHLLRIAPNARVTASEYSFPQSERDLFTKVWQAYVTGSI